MEKQKLVVSKMQIEINKVFKDFTTHLTIPENCKILFSGKYGTGKSYFLKEYFSEQESKDKYNVITISPVNYVVSPNEDIFELIKIDIIKNLFIDGKLDFLEGEYSFGKDTVILEYIRSQKLNFLKHLAVSLSKIGVLGEETKQASEATIGFLKHFKKFEDSLNEKHKPKGNVAKEHLDDWYERIGTYIEFNIISEIIKDTLMESKRKDSKEYILIIEDFDRLDPAHIFRILNILSAHSLDDSSNKFGFNKVMIVCDLGNIRSLYEHMYGSRIDFDGYIDKFYSCEPYFFDNKKAIYTFLKTNLELNIPEYALNFLVYLLNKFVSEDKITLRKIMKTHFIESKPNSILRNFSFKEFGIDSRYSFPPHIDNKIDSIDLYLDDVPLVTIVKYLKTLLGGLEELKKIIKDYTKENFVLPPNISLDIVATFSIPTLLLSANPKDMSKIFFKDLQGYQYPEYSIGSIRLLYNPWWSAGDKYKGGRSFFEKASFTDLSDNSTGINFRSVMEWVDSFLKKVYDEDWL